MVLATKTKVVLILFGLFLLAIFISRVFSGRLILPQTFSLGPIAIHYYGLFIALSVLAGWKLAKKRARNFGLNTKFVDDIIFWVIIGGFIGARLYHVFSSYTYYYSYPLEAFKVWQGGLSIYGAVFGGILSVFIFIKLSARHLALSALLNWLTPSLLLGQIIGRFGNLFNYEAYGLPTNLPWKMFVPDGFRTTVFQMNEFYHPWFLYEQIGLIIIFWIIWKIAKSEKDPRPVASRMPRLRKGQASLFFVYLLLYNTLRFGLDYRLNAIISAILAFAALLYIIKKNRIEHA